MTQKKILVVGGGISGITAAIEASEGGCEEVILVEKNPYLGGRVAQAYQYFPKLCPPLCGMEINLRRLRTGGRIRCLTLAEVESISGESGNYKVTVKVLPRYVNEKCTACGACAGACPSERPNAFNYGLDRTKAAYIPFEGAFPLRYVIDREACGESCSKCAEACQYQAIDLEMQPRREEFQVGAVIITTGWRPNRLEEIEELGHGRYPNVVTNYLMERMAALNGPTSGMIRRPSDQKEIESVAFVQCAGSRDENYLGYCSGVCCMGSLKQATYIRERYPDARIYIFYIDIRTPGRLEDFYAARQEDEKISLIKGKVAKIEEDPSSKDLVVEAEDILSGRRVRQKVNLVVLAGGMVPAEIGAGVAGGLKRDDYGFLLPEQDQSGILTAGCAKRPVDVASSVRDATGAALKALQSCM